MCCHNPNGTHWEGEPAGCCHVHAEALPSNNDTSHGDLPTPPEGWTAQYQHRVDQLTQRVAELESEDGERDEQEGSRHQPHHH